MIASNTGTPNSAFTVSKQTKVNTANGNGNVTTTMASGGTSNNISAASNGNFTMLPTSFRPSPNSIILEECTVGSNVPLRLSSSMTPGMQRLHCIVRSQLSLYEQTSLDKYRRAISSNLIYALQQQQEQHQHQHQHQQASQQAEEKQPLFVLFQRGQWWQVNDTIATVVIAYLFEELLQQRQQNQHQKPSRSHSLMQRQSVNLDEIICPLPPSKKSRRQDDDPSTTAQSSPMESCFSATADHSTSTDQQRISVVSASSVDSMTQMDCNNNNNNNDDDVGEMFGSLPMSFFTGAEGGSGFISEEDIINGMNDDETSELLFPLPASSGLASSPSLLLCSPLPLTSGGTTAWLLEQHAQPQHQHQKPASATAVVSKEQEKPVPYGQSAAIFLEPADAAVFD